MKGPNLLLLSSIVIGALIIATHAYVFLHLPSGVALGSAAGTIAIVLFIKAVLVRAGIHRLLRRSH